MTNKRYLQRLGQSWYLRVKVPPSLQSTVRNTHIRRALHTRDLDEANRRKWPALAEVRAYFDSLRPSAASRPATLVPSVRLPQAIASLAAAYELRASDGLDDLVQHWVTTSHSKTVQFQRRQAYGEVRAFLGQNVQPKAVTAPIAATYVDTCLLLSRDSTSTRRRKLSALASFWEWLAIRGYVDRGSNPWRGFRLTVPVGSAAKPSKRPYTDDELATLFSGNPTYPTLREVMVLGLYTGARIDEICSLTQADVHFESKVALVRIERSKTRAGVRKIAVAHHLPLSVLTRRWNAAMPGQAQLFPELRGGGYDQKLSWHVGQAFRYHRNGRGLQGCTDFHSLRRTFITRLENLGVDQVHIARYVGHSLPTLAFKLYSGGATDATQIATAKAIHYPSDVEAAVRAFLAAG